MPRAEAKAAIGVEMTTLCWNESKKLLYADESVTLPEKIRSSNVRLVRVDVAIVFVALKYDAVTFPATKEFPMTESLANGEVEPIPTLPLKYELFVFGSKNILAVVVELEPIEMISVLLSE